MAGRIRTIKPEAFKDADLWDAEQESGLPLFRAYTALWCQADREGRFAWKPRELKLDCLPYWDGDFSRVLDALVTRGFLVRYVSQGRIYGWIPTLKDHQYFNGKEPKSKLPPPTEESIKAGSCERVNDASGTGELRVVDAPSFPFPSLPVPEGVQGEPNPAPKRRPKDPLGDQLRGRSPCDRDDVQQVHAVFRETVGLPHLRLRGSQDLDADRLAETIDLHGLATCLTVARECIHDRMVTGEADERGMEHKSVGYVFGNATAFARILRDAEARARKRTGVSITETMDRAMSAEPDLSDYVPPKKATKP